MTAPRVLVVVNPESGGGALRRRWPDLERQIREFVGARDLNIAFTHELDHGAGFVRSALRDGAKRVIAVGGDGTLSDLVQGFFHQGSPVAPDAELALVPGGRGNDFFRMIQPRRSLLEGGSPVDRGLELLKKGTGTPTDLIHCRMLSRDGGMTTRYCVNLASFGFGGHVVTRLSRRVGVLGKSFFSKGSLAYVLHSLATFLEYKKVHVRVRVDDKDFYEGPLMMGALLNGAYNAGGLCWSKQARIDDGLLDVVLVPPLSPQAMPLIGKALIGGDLVSVPGVLSAQGKKVEVVDLDPALHRYKLFEVDGDLPEPPGLVRAEFEVLAAAIRIRR